MIVLDSNLEHLPKTVSNKLSYSLSKIANQKVDEGYVYKSLKEMSDSKLRHGGLVGLLSNAYTTHGNVIINPHDLWITVTTELSKYVTKKSNTFRDLFTDSDEKKLITVSSSSMTEIPVGSLVDVLKNLVLFDSSSLLPQFSTNTPFIDEIFKAVFLDMSSSYYDYAMYCCGINQIKLNGTVDDYVLMKQSIQNIKDIFTVKDSSLTSYFDDVISIVNECITSFTTDNSDFWKDIFTQKNVGSGGDLTINGWITKLFITKHEFAKITNFCDNYAVVSYKQLQTGNEFKALYGAFDYELNDGFAELSYDKYVFQKIKRV